MWVAGSKAIDQAGVYGSLGVASASNMPGAFARMDYVAYLGSFSSFGAVPAGEYFLVPQYISRLGARTQGRAKSRLLLTRAP